MKRSVLNFIAAIFGMVLFSITLFACSNLKFAYTDKGIQAELDGYTPAFPEVRFAVFSDPHIYDVALGTEGEDFQEYTNNDRKMLVESEEILIEAMDIVKRNNIDFVLVPGDLTKDGEKSSHKLFAAHLSALINAGIAVYVVPGNHDILNPHAFRFTKAGHEKVAHVTPADFAEIYSPYGYGQAVARDLNSLSYVAEPVRGLWLLALDSACYENNFEEDYPQTGGKFVQPQIDWIESILIKAARQNKSVIAFMHHGILEHYDTQEKYFEDYIIENYKKISNMLAQYKVRLVFTGHYHAHDITSEQWDPNTYLYDVETGSLVTYPCPIRFVEISSGQKAEITSTFITELPSFKREGKDFQAFARDYVRAGIEGIAVKIMVDLKMKKTEAEKLSGQIADAFLAHYRGDENFTGETMLQTRGLSFIGGLVVGNRKALIEGLWEDKPPKDNNIIIDLTTGEWREY